MDFNILGLFLYIWVAATGPVPAGLGVLAWICQNRMQRVSAVLHSGVATMAVSQVIQEVEFSFKSFAPVSVFRFDEQEIY
jgi:hypothetical protein